MTTTLSRQDYVRRQYHDPGETLQYSTYYLLSSDPDKSGRTQLFSQQSRYYRDVSAFLRLLQDTQQKTVNLFKSGPDQPASQPPRYLRHPTLYKEIILVLISLKIASVNEYVNTIFIYYKSTHTNYRHWHEMLRVTDPLNHCRKNVKSKDFTNIKILLAIRHNVEQNQFVITSSQ